MNKTLNKEYWQVVNRLRHALNTRGFDCASELLVMHMDNSEYDEPQHASIEITAVMRDLARAYLRTPQTHVKRRWNLSSMFEAASSLDVVASGDWKPDIDGSCFELDCAKDCLSMLSKRSARLKHGNQEWFAGTDLSAARELGR